MARFSGDEFVVVLLNTTEDGAAQVAEAFRTKIEDLTITTNKGIRIKFSASLGVAAPIPNQDQVPKDLTEFADQALYKAKEIGRNRVVRASETLLES